MLTKNEAQRLLIDYLYDEISDPDRIRLESALKIYPELRMELNELQETRTVLGKIPMEEPARTLLVIQPDTGRFRQWLSDAERLLLPQSLFARAGMAVAALFLALFMLAAVSSAQLQVTEAGWSLSIGAAPPAGPAGIDEERLLELAALIRQENLERTEALVEESRRVQNEQLQATAESMYRFFENRRQEDLILIEQAFTQLEEENTYRHILTNEALGDLLFTLQQ